MRELKLGDVVIRRHRLLKTRGEVVEITKAKHAGVRLLWVKWAHPTTLPNPSLEMEDTLDRALHDEARAEPRPG